MIYESPFQSEDCSFPYNFSQSFVLYSCFSEKFSGYNRPINTTTPISKQAVEYGTQRILWIESFTPFASSTSPDLANVCVASGRCVTVLVTVIGVPVMPTLFLVTDEVGEALPESEDVALVGEALMMEALAICMHPLGEHSDAEGQHPPPVTSEHWNVPAMHFGGLSSEGSHRNSE